ncbi:hypothetical protein [Paenibacillus illinoisensis]|uniref:hypothetical protein n=1 Tax=Paenibacillus illinoisensis TaxID=59845 RepID=UPI0030188AC3
MDKYALLRILYAKYNELESINRLSSDEDTLLVVKAKQETIDDMIKIIEQI